MPISTHNINPLSNSENNYSNENPKRVRYVCLEIQSFQQQQELFLLLLIYNHKALYIRTHRHHTVVFVFEPVAVKDHSTGKVEEFGPNSAPTTWCVIGLGNGIKVLPLFEPPTTPTGLDNLHPIDVGVIGMILAHQNRILNQLAERKRLDAMVGIPLVQVDQMAVRPVRKVIVQCDTPVLINNVRGSCQIWHIIGSTGFPGRLRF